MNGGMNGGMDGVVGLLPYLVAGWLLLVGMYGLATSRNLIHAVGCLAVAQSSTYVLLLTVGFRRGGTAPVYSDTSVHSLVVDPVVQALALTDVVVGATVTALLLSLVIQLHKRHDSIDPDRLNGLRG
jgi:multicomponent Na+:H+ antiporter subunit C